MPRSSSQSSIAHLIDRAARELELARERGLHRQPATIEAIDGASIQIAGRRGVCYSSNDYLGLSTHPRLVEAACEAARRWGVGARAARLLAGSTSVHAQLEERLAAFYGADAAIVFSSGYLANLGTLQALATRDDIILVDRLAHASLIDAARQTRARLLVFRHNDVDHVEQLLRRYGAARRCIIVTEGIFSMDGDAAPLRELTTVGERHGAWVYVDDAHGAFVAGPTGRGSAEAAGVPIGSVVYLATLGKALGCQGGFVVGPAALIDWLRNRSRTFIYSTAPATPVMAAALVALDLVDRDGAPRNALARAVRTLNKQLDPTLRPPAPARHIMPIRVGKSDAALRVSAALWEQGCFAPAVRPPTVPAGTARLRVSLSSLHTDEQLARLAAAVNAALAPRLATP